MRRRGWTLADRSAVVQGFGNVGSVAAEALHERGVRVVGVSDVTGGLTDPAGLDVPRIKAWVREHKTLRGCPVGQPIDGLATLELPCDILVPAAVEGQITTANAGCLQCSIVVEAANGPTTVAAESILAERGILVVPDILANAGGVCVSYFEWAQSLQRGHWADDEVERRMRTQLHDALGLVLDEAHARSIDLRTAAMVVAVGRVADAAEARGVYP